MHKLVFIALGLFLIASLVLIIFERDSKDTIEMIAVKESRSLLIENSNETFEIGLYISGLNSFLTEKENIASFKIHDDLEELDLSLQEIIVGEEVTYNSTTYWQHHFRLGFDEIYVSGAIIDFENAYCLIVYNNEVTIDIAIGSLALCFLEMPVSYYLDFTRLSGTTTDVENTEVLNALKVEFDLKGLEQVTITSINTFVSGLIIDLGSTTTADEATANPDCFHIEEGKIVISDDCYLTIPIQFQQKTFPVFRFPLVISYTYLNEDCVLVIDDFQYYRKAAFFEVDHENIASYIHHY